MKNYYNRKEHDIYNSNCGFLIMDCAIDLYGSNYIMNNKEFAYEFVEWLCQENLIGNDITPEIVILYKLSS